MNSRWWLLAILVFGCEKEVQKPRIPVSIQPVSDASIATDVFEPDSQLTHADAMADDASETHREDSGQEDAGMASGCRSHTDCLETEYCADDICVDCGKGSDCNQNGYTDACDLIRGRSVDCDSNYIPDECDLSEARSIDCNQNQVLDECELVDDGCTSWGRNDYIEYVAGNIPLVVSAPHGGTLRPTEIPARQGGTQVRDTNTTELARTFYEEMRNHLGGQPHLILVHLHRTRLDANRSIGEAAEGQTYAEQAWTEYHHYLDLAKRSVVQNYGRGLYLDFHGLNSSRTKIELGYLLTSSQLNIDSTRMQHLGYANFSSIRTLAHESTDDFEQLLRGSDSLGSLLTNRGYDSVPSTQFPDPDGGPYYRGGYNTVRHGSISGGPISGIQIEHNWAGVRDNPANRTNYTRALAESTDQFFISHFRMNLRARNTVEIKEAYVELIENGTPSPVKLHRTGDLSERITVSLRYAGTSTLNEDLQPLPAQMVFEPGQSETQFEVIPNDDSDTEGPDTIEVYIQTSTTYNRVSPHSTAADTTIIIHDNERPSISVSISQKQLAEPQDSTSVIVACIPPQELLGVELESIGTATADLDFGTNASSMWENERLSLDISGVSGEHSFQLTVLDDGDVEGLETVEIQARNTSQYSASPVVLPPMPILDDDIDASMIQWWPGRIAEGKLTNLIPEGDSPRVLPYGADGPQVISGPNPSFSGLQFDGRDDIVFSPDIETATSSEFTLSLWFRYQDLPTNSYAYLYSHSSSGSSQYLHVYISTAGTLRTAIRGSDDQNAYSALDVSNALTPDTWHHYALTVTTSSAGVTSTVFLDGASSSSAMRGGPEFNPSGFVSLGGRYDLSSARHFAGDISDIRIYTKRLSPADIQALAN